MIEKAKQLAADEVFLDLEDAVAPDAKAEARARVASALAEPGWAGQLRGVRVNDWTTPWTHADVIEVVAAAGSHLDLVVLPKVTDASHVQALDLLLTQLETIHGLPPGRIGVEAQIENARGLTNVDAIAAAPRVQALVLGPADMMASLNMRTLVVGEQPEGYDVGDAYHHVLMRILIAARTHGINAIDGPYLKVRDVEAFRRIAGRSAALGYDGKWVLHPDQIAAGNEIFSPRQDDYDHAELILEAYDWHTSRAGGARGAVMLGDEMIDEASCKMALVIAGKGRAAGMARTGEPFWPPEWRLDVRPVAGVEADDEQEIQHDSHGDQGADYGACQRETVALLAGALGLAHRDDAKDESDDGRQPAEHEACQRAGQRSDRLAVGAWRLHRPVGVVRIGPVGVSACVGLISGGRIGGWWVTGRRWIARCRWRWIAGDRRWIPGSVDRRWQAGAVRVLHGRVLQRREFAGVGLFGAVGHDQAIAVRAKPSISVTAPTAMPAMARPWPCSPVRLTWLSATTPITMPAMEPIPQSQMTEATNDAIANAFVPWTGAP
jgi:citrate lyase subunit beta/citryl-CoA lyase